MIEDFIREVLENHKGKTIGVVLGLIVGFLLINFGFWKTLLLAIMVFIGYVVGNRIDQKDDFREIIQRFIYSDKRNR